MGRTSRPRGRSAKTAVRRASRVAAGGGTAPPFEADARPVLEALAETLARIVHGLPEVHNARQLQQRLDLDYALAWQVYRLAIAVDPLAAGAHVPRRAPFERLLTSAERVGTKRILIETARAVYQQYELLVRRHAADRGNFDSLIAGLRRESAASLDLRHRRAAFRANAHLWGMRLAARVQLAIYVPGARNGRDSASVSGWVGLSASRANATMTVPVAHHMRTIDPVEGRAPRIEDRARQSLAIELLEAFSSRGLPRFESVHLSDGREVGNLRLSGVGQASAVTFFMLATAPHACDDPVLGVGTLLRVPSRALHSDLLVAEGCALPSSAELAIYARTDLVDQTAERRPEDRLSAHAAVSRVAGVVDVPRIPDVPQYSELVRHVLERMGWAGRKFDLYRARIEYPMLHGFVELSARRV